MNIVHFGEHSYPRSLGAGSAIQCLEPANGALKWVYAAASECYRIVSTAKGWVDAPRQGNFLSLLRCHLGPSLLNTQDTGRGFPFRTCARHCVLIYSNTMYSNNAKSYMRQGGQTPHVE